MKIGCVYVSTREQSLSIDIVLYRYLNKQSLERTLLGVLPQDPYFADLYKKCRSVAVIPAQYLQAVREQLAGQGIVLNGCV